MEESMAKVDRTNMAKWIDRVFRLNQKYYGIVGAKMGSAIEQQLGPPASEEAISEFEERLGYGLPPSYRLFLSLHDGWNGIEGKVNLLSIAKQRRGEYARYIKKWKKEQWEDGETLLIEGLIIGIQLHTNNAWVLDTSRVDDRGEMEVVIWQDFETERDRDFLDALQKKAEILERLIAEEEKKASTE
jgi:hypothetical protein